MAVGKTKKGKMAPVHFFSHGSTMMLGEEHSSAKYWEKMGDLALANGLEHVVMMVSKLQYHATSQRCLSSSDLV